MKRFKKKSIWLRVLGVVLVVALLGAGAVGISKIFVKNDSFSKTLTPKFSLGSLNSSGVYEKSDSSLYTKNAFECQGLSVSTTVQDVVSFEVFFYAEDLAFIGSSGVQTGVFDSVPLDAKYARVVITPINDSKISWFEKFNYVKKIKIEVDTKQDFESTDVALLGKVVDRASVNYSQEATGEKKVIFTSQAENMSPSSSYVKIELSSNVSKLHVFLDEVPEDFIINTSFYGLFFADDDLNMLESFFDNDSLDFIVDVPTGATFVYIHFVTGYLPAVYQIF